MGARGIFLRGLGGCLAAGLALLGLPASSALATSGRSVGGQRSPASGVVIYDSVPYKTVEGFTLTMKIWVPTVGGPYPAMVMLQGGGWDGGDEDWTQEADTLTSNGFVAFYPSMQQAPPGGPFHAPVASDDIHDAILWVRAHASDYNVDPTEVGAIGSSTGGNVAMMAGVTGGVVGQDRPNAVVSWSGPTDFPNDNNRHGESNYVGCDLDVCPDLWKAASPLYQVNSSDPPMYLANSDHEIVPVAQAIDMAKALTNAGVPNLLHILPGTVHGKGYEDLIWPEVLDFLHRYMGGQSLTTAITFGPADATNSPSATFTFQATGTNITYKCSVDGHASFACTSPDTVNGLSEGAHTFSVQAKDGQGNVGPSNQWSWRTDFTAPSVSLVSGPTDPSRQTSAAFTFRSGDPAATFSCSLDGGAFASCVSGVVDAGLAAGSHAFVVEAIDAAGNVSAPATRSWLVQPLVASFSKEPGALTSKTTGYFTFSATGGATFTCSLDGAAAQSCTSPVSAPGLGLGPNTFLAQPTDPNGKPGDPATAAWTVADKPFTTITKGPRLDRPATDTTASFVFTSPNGVSFQCSLDSGSLQSCQSPAVYPELLGGTHTFSVQATDTNGTVGSPATYSWTLAPVWRWDGISDFWEQYASPGTVIGPGDTLRWRNYGPSDHTVTDTSGLNLFDSGPIAPGADWWMTFHAAGRYSYTCTFDPGLGVRDVHVLPDSVPVKGTVSQTFNIIWADITAQTGYVYDVQIDRPGQGWVDWKIGVTSPQGSFTPDAGAGTYQFRGRLRSLASGLAVGYSNPVVVPVTA